MFRLKLTGQDNEQRCRDVPKAVGSFPESNLQAYAALLTCHFAGEQRRGKHA